MEQKQSILLSEPKPKRPADARFLEAVNEIIVKEGFKNPRQFMVVNNLNTALLSKIRSGLQSVSQDVLEQLASKYNLDLNYIYSGEGSIFKQPAFIAGPESNGMARYWAGNDAPYTELPFISTKASASFVENFGQQYPTDGFETYGVRLAAAEIPKNSVVIEIHGESMAEQLRAGSKVLATPIQQADWCYLSSGVYAVLYKSYFVVKRIKDNELLKTGIIMLHSDNPKFGSMPVQGEDIRSIWKITRIVDAPVE